MTLARFENLKINLTLRAEGEKKDINNLVRSFKRMLQLTMFEHLYLKKY